MNETIQIGSQTFVPAAERDALRIQRDALLAAAKAALDALESQHEDSDETVLELRKAIKDAEGESK